MGDLAYCTLEAPFGRTRVDLWISVMGSGAHRNTLGGMLAEHGVVHCRAKANVVGEPRVEVRRRTLFDRIIPWGVRVGNAEFDAKYVAFGKEEDVRRFLSPPVVEAFLGMWRKTRGLCVEDGEVLLSGQEFVLDEAELVFIVDTVGTIATSCVEQTT